MNTIPFKGSASFIIGSDGSRMSSARKEFHNSVLVCSKFEDLPLLGDQALIPDALF
jgi:hypothetical protein